LAEISFFVLFKQSKKIKYSAPLNFMAEISYPLYLVHTTTGYLIITLVYLRFQSPLLSILIALTSCIALAYVLHILIEIPGQKLGKSLISRLRVQLPKAARN
jgi:peptidoglycan/LPS O-acetylase OafA/YrhL